MHLNALIISVAIVRMKPAPLGVRSFTEQDIGLLVY